MYFLNEQMLYEMIYVEIIVCYGMVSRIISENKSYGSVTLHSA
jgi:hypothetical protein